MKTKNIIGLAGALKDAERYLSTYDPVLEKIINSLGPCTITPRIDYFEALVRSIIGQQLSVKVASSIFGKLKLAVKDDLSPEQVIALNSEQFKTAGLSSQKATYITHVAEAFIRDKDAFANLDSLSNEAVLRELTRIKGIGLWTGQIFLIFSLCRLDVLPLGDAGFRRSVAIHYGIEKPSDAQLIALAGKWGPYSSVAVWYLWKSLDTK